MGHVESMKKIYYEKVGRRYQPVAEYDNDLLDSFPKGSHLVMCYPGGSSRRFHVDPNYAAMIAAGRLAEDEMCRVMAKASELRPQRTPLTEAQRTAWRALSNAFGEELCTLQGNSVRDIVEAGVEAMQKEANQLMAHPAVKDAYEKFLFTCELVKNGKTQT
jgi:hypothetical protein